MSGIPLVQDNEKDSINTSIIAIKRALERINQLLGLSDGGGSDPDLSGLATKQELQDAVNSLQPVDEVTLNNMQSVTSNAVARANTWVDVTSTWVASAKSRFNDTNFNYKVVKRYNIDNTYTYRITALSPSVSEASAYIRFSQLPRTVFGFTAEGSTQTSDGTVISTYTGFANTRDSKGSSNVNVNIAFFSDRLELQFTSYASDRSNQGLCTWELTVNKDLDTYFA